MMMTIPTALYEWTGAVLSALIVVLCTIGLTLHSDVYAHVPRKHFYCYYTNLSNLLVLAYFGAVAPFLYMRKSSLIPTFEFSVTMAILLTHLVFHFMIYPAVKPMMGCAKLSGQTRMMAADNLIIHYLVPWTTLLYWLLCAPGKQRIPGFAAMIWLVFPLVYAIAVLLRGRSGKNLAGTQHPYPYPFLDVQALGLTRVLRTCALLTLLGALLSAAILWAIKLLFAVFGDGHDLFLI